MKTFVQIENYENRGSLEGWITHVAITVCLNLLRTAQRQSALTFADLNDDETHWLEEKVFNVSISRYRSEEDRLVAADLLNRLLKTLSPEDALVLKLLDGERESIGQIAEMTGWSEFKVKIRAFRARKKIRQSLRN